MTFKYPQAKQWAIEKTSFPHIQEALLNKLKISKPYYTAHPDSWIPVCLMYDLDFRKLSGLHGKQFLLPDEDDWEYEYKDWERFVKKCRSGIGHSYDYVYGPVAGRHELNAREITLSKSKEQLSLNSYNAIGCLGNVRVIRIRRPKEGMGTYHRNHPPIPLKPNLRVRN